MMSGRREYPAFDSESELNWRAKPVSTNEPTQRTTDRRTLSLPHVAKEG